MTDRPAASTITSRSASASVVPRASIDARNLSKQFKLYAKPSHRLVEWLTLNRVQRHTKFTALRDVSFTLQPGECLGIVGENGSGKSTLLKILTGTLAATSGACEVQGRVLALLELGTGFNPELTGRQNIQLSAQLLGLESDYVSQRLASIADFAGLGEFLDRPIRIYSSGMLVRLAFSLFAFLEPDVLIVDEALAVGDAAFQRKCYRRMEEMIGNERRAVIIVSHDTQAITRFCTKALWLDHGQVRMTGNPTTVVEAYLKQMLGRPEDTRDATTPASDPSPLLNQPSTANGLPTTGLLPRSEAAVVYPSDGLQLLGVWLENDAGQVITHPQTGQGFSICYSVRFTTEIDSPNFGTRLTTKRGDILFGTNTRQHDVQTGSFQSNQIATLRWPIAPGLAPTDYFLSCGCVTGDEPMRYLLREVDAYQFVVLGNATSDGLATLVGAPQIQKR